MHEILLFLKELNIPTILASIGAMWYFTRGIKSDIKEIKQEMKEMRDEIHEELHADRQKYFDEFKFMNVRLARTEGTIYGKDIYKQSVSSENQQ